MSIADPGGWQVETITLELDERQIERLERAAKQLGRSAEETVGLMLEEALRAREFPLIEFRDTVVGRQPYLKGTRLKVWMIEVILQDLNYDLDKAVDYFEVPIEGIAEAKRYADTYREEVEQEIAANDIDPEELKKRFPNLIVFEVDAPAS